MPGNVTEAVIRNGANTREETRWAVTVQEVEHDTST